ncbi:MAG: phosphodiester glycosidase family protein [Deltaproteobacteria bacterium]|nr:phosphodiester glycosidase family protein [Deltaproteobacteria bacterium]
MRLGLAIIIIASIPRLALARPGDVGDPLTIPGAPFVHRASTALRGSAIARYSCKPTASEAGPEVVYVFHAPASGRVTATVDGDNGSVDVDVHLLSSLNIDTTKTATNCLARGDRIAETRVLAGPVFAVVDTFQAATHAGVFTLRFDFQPDNDWAPRPVARGVTLKTKAYDDLFGARQSTSVLEVDLAEPSVVVKPILASTCATTSSLARGAGAVAAINAGFFDTSTGSCGSVSLVKIDGQLLARNAKSRTSFGLDAQRRPLIERVAAGADWPAATQAVGGVPRIVTAGRVDVRTIEEGAPAAFGTARHPRTTVGISTGGGLVFATVDGRTTAGAGMSLAELAQWMIWLGVANAVNLDGGGSTTMWVKGEPWGGVVNYPSDNGRADHAGERAVGSALGVWAAPLDRDLVWLTSPPPSVRLRSGDTWAFEAVVADPEGRAVTIRAAVLGLTASNRVAVQDRGDGTAQIAFTADATDVSRSPIRFEIAIDVAGGRSFSTTIAITVDAPDAGSPPLADAGQNPDLNSDAGSNPSADDAGVDPSIEIDGGALRDPSTTDGGPSPSAPPTTPNPESPLPGEPRSADETTGCSAGLISGALSTAIGWPLFVAFASLVTLASRRRGKERANTRSGCDR